ncbi:MAG: DsbA family protein [Candidatus Saccharimonadales bacterium]
MSKQFWLAVIIIAAILGGIVLVTNHNQANSGNTNTKPTEHVEGSDTKHVTLIEYGDYECPICEEFYPTVKQVVADYITQIKFQFRNLPLTQIHPNAFAGARAAEAASDQNKFWQMHDLLYDNQTQWVSSSNPLTYFDSYAKQLGLNMTTFNKDYASNQVNNAINADIAAFNKTGDEMATPTFILDGKTLNNENLIGSNDEPSVAAFSTYLNAAIAKQNPS